MQRIYLLANQRHEVRQRRQITIALGIGFAIVAMLAAFTWMQRNTAISETNSRATAQADAEYKARVARSRELAALSISNENTDYAQSLLLSVEGFKLMDNVQTRGSMITLLQAHSGLRRIIYTNAESVNNIDFRFDGKIIASGNVDSSI